MAELGEDSKDLVSLDDAVLEFGISRRTLNRLLQDERLVRYKRRGDRKVYVSRAALGPQLAFHEVRAAYDSPEN